jgi:hypothetical protein
MVTRPTVAFLSTPTMPQRQQQCCYLFPRRKSIEKIQNFAHHTLISHMNQTLLACTIVLYFRNKPARLRTMKFSLLAAAALCGSTVNAEIYFQEQFNDDVSLKMEI